MDVNTNFRFNEKFEIGESYRFRDSFGAMVNYAISPALRIGYAYDYTTSALNATTSYSHEIIVLFDLNFSRIIFDPTTLLLCYESSNASIDLVHQESLRTDMGKFEHCFNRFSHGYFRQAQRLEGLRSPV